jgi:hypothetical protein
MQVGVKWFLRTRPDQLWSLLNLLFNPLIAKLNPIYHLLTLLGAHHILHVSGLRVNMYWGYFPGVKPPVRRVDDSPPSSAEVKNGWSYTSAALYTVPSWRGKGQLYLSYLLSSRLAEVITLLLKQQRMHLLTSQLNIGLRKSLIK